MGRVKDKSKEGGGDLQIQMIRNATKICQLQDRKKKRLNQR